MDIEKWECNEKSYDIEHECRDDRNTDIDRSEKWQSNIKYNRYECYITIDPRRDLTILISSSEFLECFLEKYIGNSRIERIIAKWHTYRSKYETHESICENKSDRWDDKKYLRYYQSLLLSPPVSDHTCRYLEEHTHEISDPRIETDLIRVCIWKREKIYRKYRYKVPPTCEVHEKVFPEIWFYRRKEHVLMISLFDKKPRQDTLSPCSK